MLTDGLTEKQNAGVGEDVEVLDVSQLLLASVKRGDPHTNGQHTNGQHTATEAQTAPQAEPTQTPADKPADSG
jgi:ribosomal protein S13